jgi:inorganic pyrophosphatase
MVNIWHDVPAGDDTPKLVNAAIEIPRRSRAKYEICKETGLLKLDRVLYSAVYYPANYGFIPQTLGEDNDPVDIMVLSYIDAQPLCLMRARVIGVMRMVDNGEVDDKIIAVCEDDMSVSHIHDLEALPPHFTLEIQHFFSEYKHLEGKTVEVQDFQGREIAWQIIEKGMAAYKAKFNK